MLSGFSSSSLFFSIPLPPLVVGGGGGGGRRRGSGGKMSPPPPLLPPPSPLSLPLPPSYSPKPTLSSNAVRISSDLFFLFLVIIREDLRRTSEKRFTDEAAKEAENEAEEATEAEARGKVDEAASKDALLFLPLCIPDTEFCFIPLTEKAAGD